jgi:hypothetical protein
MCLTLAVLGSGLILGSAGTAAASSSEPTTSWTESYLIQFGDKGEEIGSATVTRTDGSTHDTIVVEYTVTGGYTESQLCVSADPFTSRVPPGSCEYKDTVGGTSGSYTLTVGATEVVYLQLHITTRSGETAYVGWLHGNPAYGNVEVPNVEFCPDGETLVSDMPDGDCDPEEVVYCPGTQDVVMDGTDANDDGIADECQEFCPDGETLVSDMPDGDCDPFVPPGTGLVPVVGPTLCPVGTVMSDDGSCVAVLPDSGVEPTTPTPSTPAQPATPGEPAAPAAPATPPTLAEPVPTVLPSTATPTVVPVVAEAPAQADAGADVLGAQVTRAPLAATGSSSSGLAAFGALLVLFGASATMAGRRTARI